MKLTIKDTEARAVVTRPCVRIESVERHTRHAALFTHPASLQATALGPGKQQRVHFELSLTAQEADRVAVALASADVLKALKRWRAAEGHADPGHRMAADAIHLAEVVARWLQ
jgi:hypothetical protein